jgi:MFS transporter, ACS family, glucarate transporter
MEKANCKPTRFRWVVLILIFLAYMIAGADRANIGMVVPFIKDEFKLSNTDIGAMSSLFYIGYAAIQVPIGLIYSRYGVRFIFVMAMIFTSISTFVMGFVNSGFQLKAARVALGIAEGPINIGIVSTINRWYPQKEKGLATGVFMSSIKFAPAVVPPLCAIIIMNYGWREIFYFFAIPGFVIAALWFWFVRDDPKDSKYCSEPELNYILTESSQGGSKGAAAAESDNRFRLIDKLIRARHVDPLDTHRKIIFSWNIWACALGYFFMVGIAYAIMTWVPTYLIKVKQYSTLKTGLVAATPWIGAIIGNVFGGWLSDNVFKKRRKPLMLMTAVSTVFTMYSLLYAPDQMYLLALLLGVCGIFLNLGYSTFLVYPMGLASKEKLPFAASIVNCMGSLGGAFAPFVVGVILDYQGWDWVFTFLALCSVGTLLVVLSMIEPFMSNKPRKTETAV